MIWFYVVGWSLILLELLAPGTFRSLLGPLAGGA